MTDFEKALDKVIGHIQRYYKNCRTEESTKIALVLPFLDHVLGYHVFNPTILTPEYTADIGTKKGERVDFAIMQDGAPVMLIECKTAGTSFTQEEHTQLMRYFNVTRTARIGILTNGVQYQFYSDIEAPNLMDNKPFLEFSLLQFDKTMMNDLKKFTRDLFNTDDISRSAVQLKYAETIKQYLFQQVNEPGDEFVRFFATALYQGGKNAKTMALFKEVTRRGLEGFIADRVNQVIKAMNIAAVNAQQGESQMVIVDMGTTNGAVKTEPAGKEIITTAEELEGFYLIKSLLREIVQPERITYRDTLSYFGVLLDNNARKTVCRLYFNKDKKIIGIIEPGGEKKYELSGLSGIYALLNQLIESVRMYETKYVNNGG